MAMHSSGGLDTQADPPYRIFVYYVYLFGIGFVPGLLCGYLLWG